MFDIVFYTPEIPPNTGNAMRLAAVTGARLRLIRPMGFELDDAKLRRAGMDYRDRAVVTVHDDLEDWLSTARPQRVFAFTVDGDVTYSEVSYRQGDSLLFGPESVGLPSEIVEASWVTATCRLPMVPGVRSINLSNSAAIAVYEAWRQHGFAGGRER